MTWCGRKSFLTCFYRMIWKKTKQLYEWKLFRRPCIMDIFSTNSKGAASEYSTGAAMRSEAAETETWKYYHFTLLLGHRRAGWIPLSPWKREKAPHTFLRQFLNAASRKEKDPAHYQRKICAVYQQPYSGMSERVQQQNLVRDSAASQALGGF